jgi:hypothetical protein
MQATVEFAEFMGDKTHVYLSLAGKDRLVAAGGAAFAARPGDSVGIAFNPAALHLFDAAGRNCRQPLPAAG